MPLFDLQCQNPECGNKKVDVLEPYHVKDTVRRCVLCGGRVERVSSAANFTVQGYSARNGYASENT